jgi:hypothetical protein
MYSTFKASLFVVFIIFSIIGCAKQEQVEKIQEGGAEVIINHNEPYRVKGQPASLYLEKEISIDMERDEIAEIGLPDVRGIEADSKGNIYFFIFERSENFLFKFDKNGNFVRSLGRKGQGPGEIQRVSYCSIDSKDNIIISDGGNRKIIFFNSAGELSKEIKYDLNLTDAVPLENGKLIVLKRITNPSQSISIKLILCDADFKEIKELDVFDQPPFFEGGKNKGQLRAFLFEWKITKNRIYIGNEQRGYEILVYDLEGSLVRKIRKEYEPLSLPENFRKEAEDYLLKNPNAQQWFSIPEEIPPYNSFFIDDEGRLFVMTYEQGLNAGEYIHDVFNPDGVYFSQQCLKSYGRLRWSIEPLLAVAKNGRLYCLQEKESGYKELVGYKMRWE